MFTAGVLTVSDKGARGEREDRSGAVIQEMLASLGGRLMKYDVVPDERETIAGKLAEWADGGGMDIILTTGGTGLAERDITPEATLSVVDRVAPGFTEAMRSRTLGMTPAAMLSRAAAGLRGRCLIINLPGSPRAVRECLEVIAPVLEHAAAIIKGEVTEHAAH